jgi:Protein of unknown function (DUF2997)
MPAKIEFRISRDGEVKLEVSGVDGASCEQITKAFEDGLGVVTDVQKKSEYFLDELTHETEIFIHE